MFCGWFVQLKAGKQNPQHLSFNCQMSSKGNKAPSASKVAKNGRKFGPYNKKALVIYRGPKPEVKWFATAVNTTALGAGNHVCINQIAQGANVNQRVGNKISVRSISLSADMYISPPASDTYAVWPQTIRIIMLQDMNNDSRSTFPASGDFLQEPALPTISTLREDNKHRFKFLMDERVSLGGAVGSSTVPICITSFCAANFRKLLKVKMDINYTGSDGNQLNIKDNAIWIYYFTNLTNTVNVALGAVEIITWAKIRYTDS